MSDSAPHEESREEIYDLALEMGLLHPAVFVLGDRHIVGEWEEWARLSRRGRCPLILYSKGRGIRIRFESLTGWKEIISEMRKREKSEAPAPVTSEEWQVVLRKENGDEFHIFETQEGACRFVVQQPTPVLHEGGMWYPPLPVVRRVLRHKMPKG